MKMAPQEKGYSAAKAREVGVRKRQRAVCVNEDRGWARFQSAPRPETDKREERDKREEKEERGGGWPLPNSNVPPLSAPLQPPFPLPSTPPHPAEKYDCPDARKWPVVWVCGANWRARRRRWRPVCRERAPNKN